MDDRPVFSVVVPVFNGANTIAKTLVHLSDQLFNEFEVVLVDDGSVDGTADEARKVGLSKLTYIYQDRQGVSAARNRGVDAASGLYVVFLDADDYVSPNWLLDFYDVILKTDSDVCFCGVSFDFERKSITQREVFLAGAFCLKKELFLKVGGYDIALRFSENTELGWRIMDVNPTISYVNRINFVYQRNGKTGFDYIKNRIAAFNVLREKHRVRFNRDRNLGRTYYQIAAIDNIRIGNYFEGRALMWQGYKFQITHFKALLRALFVMNPYFARLIWKGVG